MRGQLPGVSDVIPAKAGPTPRLGKPHGLVPRNHHHFTYLLASGRNGTLHVGVTNDLRRRLAEHADRTGSKFTRRYGITRLVWYEEHEDTELAIAREKAIKEWRRDWRKNLIERENPNWKDLGERFRN